MEREKLSSRLGFILLSAGCAIGIGNVYRFPYVTGQNGGAIFVLFYLFFLVIMGLPIMTMEFAVGRASKKSIIKSFHELEKPGHKWHIHGYLGMIGNYFLMMFYTVISSWMLYYFYLMLSGKFENTSTEQVKLIYEDMLSRPGIMTVLMVIVVVVGFAICSVGLQKGVEKVSKFMMVALLVIMVVLAINSILMKDGSEGLVFYLKPDLNKLKEVGLINVMVQAVNQASFTLSIGIGSMAIFGSYIDREHTLLKESINIAVLDTFVAITSGLIIFPACFAFGVNPDSGTGLLFVTLPNIFDEMAGGRIWGALFFVFMAFASFTTVIAVFENIISCGMDLWGWSRKKSCMINMGLLIVLSIPCILGFNVWSGFQPFGEGSVVLDLEDYVVSNVILPVGALVYLFFCVTKYGWGFDNYLAEANAGKGIKLPRWIKGYLQFVLPIILIFLLIQGVFGKFF